MKAEHHPTLELALQVARDGSWLKVWDHGLDHGPTGMKHLTALFRLMTLPIFGMHPNGCESVPENQTLFEHVLRYHMCHSPQSIQNLSPDNVFTLLMDCMDMTTLLELGSSCYKLLYPSVFVFCRPCTVDREIFT